MEEVARVDTEDSLKLSGNEGVGTSWLSLVNLKYSGYGPFLPARQYIFHNGNSYFHFRHLFFRKRLDSMLKLFRKYINHSGFAVYGTCTVYVRYFV